MRFRVILPLVFVLASSCSHISSNSYRLKNGYRVSVGETSIKTKIFLVAGSQDSANFAQEIVDQKKFWLAQGYTEEEVACYYVPPFEKEKTDKKQYTELFKELRNCFFADPKLLSEHIKQVAKTNPEFIYLYVSSHGNIPMSENEFSYKDEVITQKMEKVMLLPKWANTYSMELQGYAVPGAFGVYHNLYKAYLFGLENPEAADDYLFTPRGLKAALNTLPKETKKYVVLQGCHTGGFVLPSKKVGAENTLRGTHNTAVLTASRSDRTSFGCNEGAHTTIFGEAFFIALRKFAEAKKIESLDWKKIFAFTEAQIREREMIIGISDEDLSKPQKYFN